MKRRFSPGSLRYFLSLTPGTLAVAGNIAGGWWALANMVYTMVLLILVESVTKEKKAANDDGDDIVPNAVLVLHVFLHTLSVATLLYGIHSGILTGPFAWLASISTGISSGIEGINSAHELIHRRQLVARMAGIWNLLLVNYGHFYIEHIRGHHKFIGTAQDPATARYGESVYHFFLRTVPAQFQSAFNIEARRLRKEGRKSTSLYNMVIRIVLIQVFICLLIGIYLGGIALLAYLHQSIIAFLLLEYVNYIEHYGLTRKEGERVNPTHSWQSDLPLSRFALIELSRHSDHHLSASKPFHQLISHDESPVLPTGYFGSFYTAFIPSLWFKKVNPVLDRFLEKSKSKPVAIAE